MFFEIQIQILYCLSNYSKYQDKEFGSQLDLIDEEAAWLQAESNSYTANAMLFVSEKIHAQNASCVALTLVLWSGPDLQVRERRSRTNLLEI